MVSSGRWEPCVWHRKDDAVEFLKTYFADEKRRVLIVAGAGFDPRARLVSETLAPICGDRLEVMLLREHRPSPSAPLLTAAEESIKSLKGLVSQLFIHDIEVFSKGAVVGGRKAARALQGIQLADYSDIVVDASALSVGITFPVVKCLLNRVDSCASRTNLHVVVVDDPSVDYSIAPIAADSATFVEGFRDGFGLSDNEDAAKLWLPNLREGSRAMLELIFRVIDPHMVCPILPFPARDPRRADKLLAEYRREIESSWSVDPRQIIYAHESDPLSLYRTILRIDSVRLRVFQDVGGSQTILTPMASKLLNLGAMLAAIERDFPVVYVEAVGYDLIKGSPALSLENPIVTHIWLAGDACPSNTK